LEFVNHAAPEDFMTQAPFAFLSAPLPVSYPQIAMINAGIIARGSHFATRLTNSGHERDWHYCC
jgi:hypothetical protein